MRKHGLTRTQIYIVWRDMMRRCYKLNHPYFRIYGGRGIKVCERWHMGGEPHLTKVSDSEGVRAVWELISFEKTTFSIPTKSWRSRVGTAYKVTALFNADHLMEFAVERRPIDESEDVFNTRDLISAGTALGTSLFLVSVQP